MNGAEWPESSMARTICLILDEIGLEYLNQTR